VMGDAIKAASKDRYTIAADMSRLLGREISSNMLDKYTSEAAEGHHPSLEIACYRARMRCWPSWVAWNN